LYQFAFDRARRHERIAIINREGFQRHDLTSLVGLFQAKQYGLAMGCKPAPKQRHHQCPTQ
jgi:hypothetical protein